MNSEQNHPCNIMVDLETLSTAPNAYILAIGAAKFNSAQGVYAEFYQAVTLPCGLSLEDLLVSEDDNWGKFHISGETVKWWLQQSEEARAVFADPAAVSIEKALALFFTWSTKDVADIKEVRIWGNGASFDNVILASAYDILCQQPPWMFWNNMCYRTVKNLHSNVPFLRTGTHHNALDDAISQAEHLLMMKVL